MAIVQTSSRLHFGLLSLPPQNTSRSADFGTFPSRRFGGVGLMVERPGIRLRAELARTWSATGPLADRVLAFASRFASSAPAPGVRQAPCAFMIEEASPEHVGLGTGTQLGLAVGRALASLRNLTMSAADIAAHVGRGERSALGVHGFEHGGILVEGGQARPGTLGPLVARAAMPKSWRVVLARPIGANGTHGIEERTALAGLHGSERTSEVLCQLVLLGMLPALAENDVDAFGEALFEFNVRAGEPFAAIQGGTYSAPAVAELVAFLRGLRVRGVGQSSWGPTVFAVPGDEQQATHLARALAQRFGEACEVLITRAADGGARLELAAGVD
jgi:beta-ribofuranosylaminobenzene 5'-phosphate synthase